MQQYKNNNAFIIRLILKTTPINWPRQSLQETHVVPRLPLEYLFVNYLVHYATTLFHLFLIGNKLSSLHAPSIKLWNSYIYSSIVEDIQVGFFINSQFWINSSSDASPPFPTKILNNWMIYLQSDNNTDTLYKQIVFLRNCKI